MATSRPLPGAGTDTGSSSPEACAPAAPITLHDVRTLTARVQAMCAACLAARREEAERVAVTPIAPPTEPGPPPPPSRLRTINAALLAAQPLLENVKDLGDAMLRTSGAPKAQALMRGWHRRLTMRALNIAKMCGAAGVTWNVASAAAAAATAEPPTSVAQSNLLPQFRVASMLEDEKMLWSCHVEVAGISHGRFYTGETPAGHTPFSWGARAAVDERCARTTALGRPPVGHTTYSWRGDASLAHLQRLAGAVHALETSVAFQKNLLHAQEESSGGGSYSTDNFTYGSTPVSSMARVFNSPTVSTRVTAMRAAQPPLPFLVFGSSLGLLGFAAATLLRVPVIGYELVPLLCQTAVRLVSEVAPQLQPRCKFVCTDMLQADVSSAGIVLLTSQCWDPALITKAYAKLVHELPHGAVVVDYRQPPSRFLRASSGPTRLVVVDVVSVAVSWSAEHNVYVSRLQQS